MPWLPPPSRQNGRIEKLDRPFGSFPCVMPASHVARIETGFAQRRRRLTSDVESIDTESDDWGRLRKLPDPVIHALRIAPDRAFHNILRAAAVVSRPSIDNLDRFA